MTAHRSAPAASFDEGSVLERPDGFYWLAADGSRELGPFPTLEDAIAAGQAPDEETFEPDHDQAVRDVEEALGVPDWVDPDTGQLADDEHTRLEDH